MHVVIRAWHTAARHGQVSKTYGATSWLPGRSARAVVVVDGQGVIRHHKVQPLSVFRPKDDDLLAAIHAAQNKAAG